MKQLIAFTGGHHNSTLEVAKIALKNGYQAVWFGQKYNSGDNKSLSAEFQEVSQSQILFLELKTGKFYKKIGFLEGIKIIFGFLQAFLYLLKYRPAIIFSSGGYISVPVVIMGKLLGIPSITHEQTVISGWANKAISPFVSKILLTYESSIVNYPKEKSLVVGLPMRKEIADPSNTVKFSPKMIYITCGKQGSHFINKSLFPIIPELVKNFTVIHQTGANTLTKDTDRARRIKDRLGDFSDRYIYAPYFFAKDSATYIRSSDLVISRAGAHTVYELMMLKKKSILIPISWVSHQEQMLNAKLAHKEIDSLIIEEKDLNSETLLDSILNVSRQKSQKLPVKLDINVAEKILVEIEKVLESK